MSTVAQRYINHRTSFQKNVFVKDMFSHLVMTLDSTEYFGTLLRTKPVIPEDLADGIVQHCEDHKTRTVYFAQTTSCYFPRNWLLPLVQKLVAKQIRVSDIGTTTFEHPLMFGPERNEEGNLRNNFLLDCYEGNPEAEISRLKRFLKSYDSLCEHRKSKYVQRHITEIRQALQNLESSRLGVWKRIREEDNLSQEELFVVTKVPRKD